MSKTDDRTRGLYPKYSVNRLSDKIGKHNECEYFVLDLMHDKYAMYAIIAYANKCEQEFPELAKDLMEKVEEWFQRRRQSSPLKKS